MKKSIKTLTIFVLSFIVSLLFAEFFLAFVFPVNYRKLPRRLPENVWRELLHKASPVPGLAYELVSNKEKHSHGALIKTNSWGMRDDEPYPVDDKSIHRIVTIGDSFTFGVGVLGERTYPNVLERFFNQNINDDQVEVLNLGVGGYSTRDEALVLKYKGIKWNPDLVVIGYTLNDPEIEPIQPLHSYYQEPSWWQYSNLLRLIAKTKRNWDMKTLGKGNYYRYLHSPKLPKWKSVTKAFKAVSRISHEKNIPVLLVVFPSIREPWKEYMLQDLHQQISDAAKENDLYVLDLYDAFSQYDFKDLRVRPKKGHPSQFGHEVAAKAIYQWISANKELFAFSMP